MAESTGSTDSPDDIAGGADPGELGVAVGPDVFSTPGDGDADPAGASSEIGMFYTHGGTPC